MPPLVFKNQSQGTPGTHLMAATAISTIWAHPWESMLVCAHALKSSAASTPKCKLRASPRLKRERTPKLGPQLGANVGLCTHSLELSAARRRSAAWRAAPATAKVMAQRSSQAQRPTEPLRSRKRAAAVSAHRARAEEELHHLQKRQQQTVANHAHRRVDVISPLSKSEHQQ